MTKSISVGDLVIQKYVSFTNIGIVRHIDFGRSMTPKNEPDLFYEYAWVQWLGGGETVIKISLLKKIS